MSSIPTLVRLECEHRGSHWSSCGPGTIRPGYVEVHASTGLPGFTILGAPDPHAREIRDRVRACFLNAGRAWPQRRIIVNVGPYGFRARGLQGSWWDLPIALGIVDACENLVVNEGPGPVLGECRLDGTVLYPDGTTDHLARILEEGITPLEVRL